MKIVAPRGVRRFAFSGDDVRPVAQVSEFLRGIPPLPNPLPAIVFIPKNLH